MLFPYGTDAPIYHRPIATVSIIVINIGLFLATGMGAVYAVGATPYDWLIIEFDRINPFQWVTGAFMHASWGHLVGNMIFLWCFGIVVEGKLGWRQFSLVYLVLCLGDGAISQIPMFAFYGGVGGCLGASGVIFALIAISLCWAPENNMHCLFFWSFFVPFQFDIRILSLGLFYGAKEMLPLFFTGFRMSTPMLHLLGMSVGFVVAIAMLKKGMVDCEGWDVISRYGDPTAPLDSLFCRLTRRLPSKQRKPIRGNDRQGALQETDPVQAILQNPSAYNPRGYVARSNRSRRQKSSTEKSISYNRRMQNPSNFDQSSADSVNQSRMRDRRLAAVTSFQAAINRQGTAEARKLFATICEHWGTHAINSKLMAAYAKLLGKSKRYLESLVPLKILVSRRAKCANQACLRIARIQFQLQNDRDSAAASLSQICEPIDESTRLQQEQLAALIRTSTTNTKPTVAT
ncbi:intramembrane serine protease GlpG [Planctomycetes bacterium K23_9]|uniref:Intramembrane serine protease GlpG n=2 Tax=Stieleria marina TaxID=1930275 RepID=A0A517NY26_9BACT|nr:intramembrane serine protease GlpG [Planctomycetes bacterium K23_9]